jgi:hypothetical protein
MCDALLAPRLLVWVQLILGTPAVLWAQDGTWYALLEVDDKIFRRFAHASDLTFAAWAARMVHGVRYNLSVPAYSNLHMQASLSQNSLLPGAMLTLRAALSEYGIPVDHRASVRAEVKRPDNSVTTLTLVENEPGIFKASTLASIQGVYRFRLLASGITMRKVAFTRGQWLSGGVVLGGDNPPLTSDPSTRAHDKQLCDLLECLLTPEVLGRFLAQNNIDANAVRHCIEQWCKQRLGSLSAQEASEREGSTAQPPQGGRLMVSGPSSELIAQLSDIIRRAQQQS